MSSLNSTAASSPGVETEASVGLVGAVLFIIVIIVVCIIRKRQRDAESTECEELSVTSDCGPKNVPGMVGSIYRQTDFKTRYRDSSCISIISDPNMRIVVEERLIDSARLALGKIIGKGTQLISARDYKKMLGSPLALLYHATRLWYARAHTITSPFKRTAACR